MLEPTAGLRPLVVIVRGKPGAGKTTLARRLAAPDLLGLPLLDRDAIKVGLVETYGEETDAVRRVIVPRSFDLFFHTIEVWLRAGVSLIAENSLRWDLHESRLRALAGLARTVVIHCDTADSVAQRRFIERQLANQRARPDLRAATIERMERGEYPWRVFDAFDLDVPMVRVDTTEGYVPGLDALVAFCRAARAGQGVGHPGQAGTAPHPAST